MTYFLGFGYTFGMTKLEKIKSNLLLWAYAWFKIPLIGFCMPRIEESSGNRFVIKIPLGYKTRNHLNAMYFGALAIGSELCIATLAMQKVTEHAAQGGDRIDFLFKDYKVEFLKRAEGDVLFICEDANIVVEQIDEAKKSEERINRTIHAYAIVPSISQTEKVATFELTLSVKRRLKKK